MTSTPDGPLISVVMPAYNEEGSIEAAVHDVIDRVFPVVPGELVAVNDGSKDRTGALLDEIAAKEPRVRVVHQKNGGHGRALRTGLDAARGEWLLLIDSDRQIPLADFKKLWEGRGKDGALGVRRVRHDPLHRLVLTRIVRFLILVTFGAWLRDSNVPFKLIRREGWLAASKIIPTHVLTPSLLLAIYARRRLDVRECEVEHLPRTTGVGSLNLKKLVPFCLRSGFQLLAFRMRMLLG